jgi:hypothetical protein
MSIFNLSPITYSYIDIFNNNKYKIKNNNIFLNYVVNEKKNIISFMKNNTFKINFTEISKDSIINKFKEYAISKWVLTDQVNEYINKTNNVYNINWNDNNIYIITDKYNTIKDRFIILIYILEYIKYKSKCKKKYNIYLVLTELVKKFPNNNEIIDTKNVNTGYTHFIKNIIFIWRLEEFEKVLFHEAIHYTKFFDHNITINYNLKINGPDAHFEAVADFYAIIYNCIYISLMIKIPIKKILMIELGFIRNQATSLYYYFNNNIIQKTPAYSYYIIKYMLFDYMINNNIAPININNKLLTNSIKNNIFINNKYIKLNTLRMTMFELEN